MKTFPAPPPKDTHGGARPESIRHYLLLSLILLLLGGCGTRSDRPAVRIALISGGEQTWCVSVPLAAALKTFEQEGLDVTVESVPSGAKGLQALLGGSVEVAVNLFEHTVNLAAEGQQVRSFFVIGTMDSRVLLVSPKTGDGIRTLADLKGRTVGVTSPGSGTHTFLNYHLRKNGIDPAAVTAVGIGAGPTAITAVERGTVDAAVVGGGVHFRLLRRNPQIKILADSSTPEGMRDLYGAETAAVGTLVAKDAWLRQNPDVARRVVRAMRRAHEWIATHKPAELRALLPESARSADEAADLDVLRHGVAAFTKTGKMPDGAPDAVRKMLEVTSDKLRGAKIDLASAWTNEYIDDSR